MSDARPAAARGRGPGGRPPGPRAGLLLLLVLAAPALAQPRLEDVPGYERYREVRRAAGRLATGGTVRDVTWTDDAVSFSAGGTRQRFDFATRTLAPFDGEVPGAGERRQRRGRRSPGRGRQRAEEPSPDGAWTAVCRDDNVILVEEATGAETPLTTEGDRKHRFGRASWVYGEELDQQEAMWWSPDSRRLAWYEFDERGVPDYILLEGLTDRRPVPRAEGYPKPGDPNPVVALHVCDIATGERVRIETGDHDGMGHYVYDVRFTPDGSRLLFNRTNRAQNVLEVVAADPATGRGAVVVREEQPTWQRNRPVMRFLEDGHRFIWETERSGYRHFELRDLDGRLLNPLTGGAFPCDAIELVDEKGGWLYFTAFGGEHPLNRHLYRVRLDGTGQERLTAAPLHHTIEMSPDGRWFLDRAEALATPPSTALCTSDGERVAMLAESDTTAFDELDLVPGELFQCTAADGETTLYGVLYKPSSFDPGKSYPLLVDVYGGPFYQQVHNRWGPVDPTCELGFLVARIDNRGTPGRGKAFEAATYRQLGTVDLADQVAAVQALARRPYVDQQRVGISGHSYGGYMAALAILRYPDVFRASVAMSAVTDWRNYDTIYTERIMSTPEDNSEGYDAGSCLTYAGQLAGHLLIMHGLVDDNVHPTNAWQLVDALEREDARFESEFFPERGHALGRGAGRRRLEFLCRYLTPGDGARRRGGPDAPGAGEPRSPDPNRMPISQPPS